MGRMMFHLSRQGGILVKLEVHLSRQGGMPVKLEAHLNRQGVGYSNP